MLEMGAEKGVFLLGSEVAAFFTQIKIIIVCLLVRFVAFDFVLFVKAFWFSGVQYSRVELTKHSHLVDEDYILNEKLAFPVKLIIAFYKYDIIAFQLLALIVLLIIYFAYAHRLQLEQFQAIERTQHYENRYAVIVEGIPLLPLINGYDEERFENMAYEKRIRLFFKKYIKENLLSKLKTHDTPERAREPLSKTEKALL